MQKNILVVDDDPTIGDLIQEVLEQAGYGVQRAYSGTEALLVLEHRRPDLVLLDLMLPGLSGEALLPRLEGLPVIVVSAKAAVNDKVNLLLGGAADYLTKPFDTQELLARITVQLRRTTQPLGAIYSHGPLRLDSASHDVTADGRPVALTKTGYALLKLLMQHPGQVLAKSVILDRIAADTPDCTETTLKTHISHLRTKLRAITGKDWVDAVWGIGFKLGQTPDLYQNSTIVSTGSSTLLEYTGLIPKQGGKNNGKRDPDPRPGQALSPLHRPAGVDGADPQRLYLWSGGQKRSGQDHPDPYSDGAAAAHQRTVQLVRCPPHGPGYPAVQAADGGSRGDPLPLSEHDRPGKSAAAIPGPGSAQRGQHPPAAGAGGPGTHWQ